MSTDPPPPPDPLAGGPRPAPEPPRLPGRGPTPANGRGSDGRAGDELLVRTVFALAGELAELRAQVAALTATTNTAATNATVTDAAAGEPGEAVGFIVWPDMDPEQRAEALGVVAAWVHEVLFVWYPGTRRVLPGCWYRHRDTLSDTAALYEVWCHAYRDPQAGPTRREQWHSAWLPGWMSRAKSVHSHRGCPDGHDPRAVLLGPAYTAGFDSYAAWFADPRGEPEPPALPQRPAGPGGTDRPVTV